MKIELHNIEEYEENRQDSWETSDHESSRSPNIWKFSEELHFNKLSTGFSRQPQDIGV